MDKLDVLKVKTQEVIDFIASKNYDEANFKLLDVNKLLDELIDFSDEDKVLVEISKYQVFLNQLHQNINVKK